MNISHKRYLNFILFFTSLTCTHIVTQDAHVEFFANSGYQTNNRGCKENKSYHDFSRNSRSDFSYDSHPAKIATNKHQLSKYMANDFRDYFIADGSTESQILNQRCLYMFDEFVKFAQTYSAYKCTVEQLYAELKNLNCLQKAYYIVKGTYCPGLQKRMQFLCNQLSTLKTVEQNNNTVLPYNSTKFNKYAELATKNNQTLAMFQAQLPEYNTLDSTYRTCTPSLSNAIEKRVKAYNSMNNVDVRYATKSYNIHNNVKQLLFRHGQDITRFNECFGNALDHTIHHESLDILDRIEFLSPNSILYDHQDALVDFAVAIVDYNHEGLTDKAIHIADLCWTLLDYGQAVIEGAALGVYSAAADILTNPIEAAVCIIAGKQVLVYQLCKVLYNVADIGITAITDSDHAKEKWNSYTEPLNNIIDAIDKKEITIRDVIKGSTAFAVGLRAQSKLLGGLGKFCNTIKQKSLTFVQNNITFKVQEYLATPEGHLLRSVAKTSCSAACPNQYQHLKEWLKIKEFTSIVDTTQHGIERLIERGFTPKNVYDTLHNPTFTKLQKDGAIVYIKQIQNKFDVIAFNEKTKKLVTAIKNVDQKSLDNLGKNHGWL